MIKGFIFDLDGVIVDTAKYHFLAWKQLADSLHIEFTETQNEQLKGISREKSLEKILNWGNTQVSTAEFNKLMDQKNKVYLSYIEKMDTSDILPDIPRVLNFLKQNKQAIALGSASKNAKHILKKTHLLEMFDVIIDGTSVAKAKPNPEVFLAAAKGLNILPKNCIVFEDAESGIEAANAAKMTSIGIGHPEILHNANDIFTDFTKISNEYLNNFISK
ncbi:beta-phosphoglucomutase [Wenyingzhuangia marina]|uniref:Beta-phosphoglucomutase n=1 Tax=Wenyingzhuangia marina TaxID=1195760 RepID=A0A1M5T9X1_9FLAO|nr:beta-phosphoglucomutase [Wenyingzhuangia marina]GGF65849.1 beta-phosphoglucomutase [Wenyingzhuangia marina]SHH47183.1 beta-phosphoglucomutase [Wenyingzhuangia marina]